MTTWHTRLEDALANNEKTWQDLFDYLSNGPAKLKKPSVYAWKPGATKRSTMMDADNAAFVCDWLGISHMWLFHGAKATNELTSQERELIAAFRRLPEQQRGIALIGVKWEGSKIEAAELSTARLSEKSSAAKNS